MKKERLFKQIERELRQYKPLLSKASDSILDEAVSKYPIFIIHQGEMELGIELINRKKNNSPWSIHASILEEFVAKQLIRSENLENFQTIFKDPETHLCLFVLSEAGANFIFLPRNNDQAKTVT